MIRCKLVVLIFFFSLLSCKKKELEFVPKAIESTLIGKDFLTHFYIQRTNRVIDNDSSWQIFLAEFDSSGYQKFITDSFTTKSIDFNTNIVLAVIDVNTIGSTIDITSVVEDKDTIFVQVDILRQSLLQVLVNPFHIISIPKSNKPIVFR